MIQRYRSARTRGAVSAEFVLIILLVAMVVLPVATTVGEQTKYSFDIVADCMDSRGGGTCGTMDDIISIRDPLPPS